MKSGASNHSFCWQQMGRHFVIGHGVLDEGQQIGQGGYFALPDVVQARAGRLVLAAVAGPDGAVHGRGGQGFAYLPEEVVIFLLVRHGSSGKKWMKSA